MIYTGFIKPVLDFILALVLCVLLLPLGVFLSISLLICFRKSPFFVQQRIGKGGSSFLIYKFRTMSDSRSESGRLLPDDQRTYGLGTLLRKLGLDELPQLINILKGEMSLVGPRPLLPEYLPLFSEEIRKRHNVKPGITGLAQIKGGNAIEWEKRFELDLKYLQKISFLTDMKILLGTFVYIKRKESFGEIGAYK